MKPGQLKKGDRVLIRGEHAGRDTGTVAEVWTVDNLPTAEDLPPARRDEVETILKDWDVSEVLLLKHRRPPLELVFVALVTSTGDTYDLHRQRLTIARIEGHG